MRVTAELASLRLRGGYATASEAAGEDHLKISPRLRIIGPELQCAPESGLSLGPATLSEQNRSQVVAGLGMMGPETDRLPVRALGICKLT